MKSTSYHAIRILSLGFCEIVEDKSLFFFKFFSKSENKTQQPFREFSAEHTNGKIQFQTGENSNEVTEELPLNTEPLQKASGSLLCTALTCVRFTHRPTEHSVGKSKLKTKNTWRIYIYIHILSLCTIEIQVD